MIDVHTVHMEFANHILSTRSFTHCLIQSSLCHSEALSLFLLCEKETEAQWLYKLGCLLKKQIDAVPLAPEYSKEILNIDILVP